MVIVNFIIQKLKSKHTSLKKYTKLRRTLSQFVYFSLVLREKEEKKQQIFRTLVRTRQMPMLNQALPPEMS